MCIFHLRGRAGRATTGRFAATEHSETCGSHFQSNVVVRFPPACMHDPDHLIIRRILAGEPRAFALLVDRHKGHGMTVAMRMLKNVEDAEEALQDAFVRAYRALDRFEFQAKFSTWFYRILYNVCSTQLARRDEIPAISLDVNDDDETTPIVVRASDATPDVDLESREFRRIVAEEVDALPAQYAGMLTMFLMEDMSYAEIVEITGLPIGTVKTQLFRARALLRDAVRKRLGAGVEHYRMGAQ